MIDIAFPSLLARIFGRRGQNMNGDTFLYWRGVRYVKPVFSRMWVLKK